MAPISQRSQLFKDRSAIFSKARPLNPEANPTPSGKSVFVS
jgi:hypothetical protein